MELATRWTNRYLEWKEIERSQQWTIRTWINIMYFEDNFHFTSEINMILTFDALFPFFPSNSFHSSPEACSSQTQNEHYSEKFKLHLILQIKWHLLFYRTLHSCQIERWKKKVCDFPIRINWSNILIECIKFHFEINTMQNHPQKRITLEKQMVSTLSNAIENWLVFIVTVISWSICKCKLNYALSSVCIHCKPKNQFCQRQF